MLLHTDANGDGHIDYKDEMEGVRKRGEIEGMLVHSDANGDGHIDYKRDIEGGDRGDVVTR